MLKLYNKMVKDIEINESVRTLRVYLNPSVKQKSQFEVMRGNLNESITKFINIEIIFTKPRYITIHV